MRSASADTGEAAQRLAALLQRESALRGKSGAAGFLRKSLSAGLVAAGVFVLLRIGLYGFTSEPGAPLDFLEPVLQAITWGLYYGLIPAAALALMLAVVQSQSVLQGVQLPDEVRVALSAAALYAGVRLHVRRRAYHWWVRNIGITLTVMAAAGFALTFGPARALATGAAFLLISVILAEVSQYLVLAGPKSLFVRCALLTPLSAGCLAGALWTGLYAGGQLELAALLCAAAVGFVGLERVTRWTRPLSV